MGKVLQSSTRPFKWRLDRVDAVFALRVVCGRRGRGRGRGREDLVDPSLD